MEILSGLLLTNAIHQRFVPSIELPLFFYDKNNPHWIIYVSENRWYYVPKGHSALSKFENNEAVMFTVSEDPKVNGLPLVEMLIPFHISYYQRLLKNCDDDYLGELKKNKAKIFLRLAIAQMATPLEKAKGKQFSIVVEDYLNSINLPSICSEIEIRKQKSHRFKPGDDDIFSVYLCAYFPDPDDVYIKSLFPGVHVDIHSNSGFQSWQSMQAEYQEDQEEINSMIKQTKEKVTYEILKKYNKNIHRKKLLDSYETLRHRAIVGEMSKTIFSIDRPEANFFYSYPDFISNIRPDNRVSITYGLCRYPANERPNQQNKIYQVFKALKDPFSHREIKLNCDEETHLHIANFKTELIDGETSEQFGFVFIILSRYANLTLKNLFSPDSIVSTKGHVAFSVLPFFNLR